MRQSNVIFSCVGDVASEYWLWLNKTKEYDTAVVYYGKDDAVWERIQKHATHCWRHPGQTFPSFVKHFSKLKYSQFLIIDNDLAAKPEQIANSFRILSASNNYALTWSQDPSGQNSYSQLATRGSGDIYQTNFIENGMIFLKIGLLKNVINFVNQYCTNINELVCGWDIVISNVALDNNQQPFLFLDFYSYRNPYAHEKGIESREIMSSMSLRNQLVGIRKLCKKHSFSFLPNKSFGQAQDYEIMIVPQKDQSLKSIL